MDQDAPASVAVTSDAMLFTPQGEIPLRASFVYDESDQTAVQMILVAEAVTPCGQVVRDQQHWGFARKLLQDAFADPGQRVGLGDVQVAVGPGADHDNLAVYLMDLEENHHAVVMNAKPIHRFLQQSLRLVPAGAEYIDVDSAIETLLDGRHDL